MTDLTDEAVKALAHKYRFAKDDNEHVIAKTARALLDARADLTAAQAQIAGLVGALIPIGSMAMWTESAADDEAVILTVGTVRKMRAALDAATIAANMIEQLSKPEFIAVHKVFHSGKVFSEAHRPSWIEDWFWREHVMKLEVGKHVDTDFQRIYRVT